MPDNSIEFSITVGKMEKNCCTSDCEVEKLRKFTRESLQALQIEMLVYGNSTENVGILLYEFLSTITLYAFSMFCFECNSKNVRTDF